MSRLQVELLKSKILFKVNGLICHSDMHSIICSSCVRLVPWQKITPFAKNFCYAYFVVKLRNQEYFLLGINMGVNTFAFSSESILKNRH